jgi:hypothetical protein
LLDRGLLILTPKVELDDLSDPYPVVPCDVVKEGPKGVRDKAIFKVVGEEAVFFFFE